MSHIAPPQYFSKCGSLVPCVNLDRVGVRVVDTREGICWISMERIPSTGNNVKEPDCKYGILVRSVVISLFGYMSK